MKLSAKEIGIFFFFIYSSQTPVAAGRIVGLSGGGALSVVCNCFSQIQSSSAGNGAENRQNFVPNSIYTHSYLMSEMADEYCYLKSRFSGQHRPRPQSGRELTYIRSRHDASSMPCKNTNAEK